MKRLLITDEDIKEYVNRNKEKWIREKKERDAKLKRLFSSYDYMNWLNSFTANTKGFSDEDFLYFPEKISKEDLDKVNNLGLFFEGIEKYADKNYIYPTMYEYQSYYGIKDNANEVYYKIGVIEGQGGSFFCDRVEDTSELDFIDFNDIMNDKVRDNAEEIELSKEKGKVYKKIRRKLLLSCFESSFFYLLNISHITSKYFSFYFFVNSFFNTKLFY